MRLDGILDQDRNDKAQTNLQTFSGTYLITSFFIYKKEKKSVYLSKMQIRWESG